MTFSIFYIQIWLSHIGVTNLGALKVRGVSFLYDRIKLY